MTYSQLYLNARRKLMMAEDAQYEVRFFLLDQIGRLENIFFNG